jgi:hypothetical protein
MEEHPYQENREDGTQFEEGRHLPYQPESYGREAKERSNPCDEHGRC